MANLSITQLPVALTLSGQEVLPLVQNGVTKQASVLQIANVVIPGKFITNIEYDNATYMMIIFYSDGTTQEVGPVPGYKNAYINGDGDLILVGTNNVSYNLGNVIGQSGYSGYSGYSGSSAASVAISNDTTTASNEYPVFVTATSGTASTIYTSNSKYLYKPSTGELTAQELVASNGIVVNNQTVSVSYSIPSGYSASSAGPMTVSSGVTVTVPSGSRWVIL